WSPSRRDCPPPWRRSSPSTGPVASGCAGATRAAACSWTAPARGRGSTAAPTATTGSPRGPTGGARRADARYQHPRVPDTLGIALAGPMTARAFPPGFLFGAAPAGHQVEGDNSTSDTWFAELVTPTVFKEPSGRACNSY